jgi:hypothetical protein
MYPTTQIKKFFCEIEWFQHIFLKALGTNGKMYLNLGKLSL